MSDITNPLFLPYGTPHDTVPFTRITLADYDEAIREGIRREDEQIAQIIADPEPATFDNTIVRVDDERDHYYDLLSRASAAFFNLLSCETTDAMDALAQELQPLLTRHANDVRLNADLFRRIHQVWLAYHPEAQEQDPMRRATPDDAAPRELTAEERMLLETCHDGFVSSGALLSPEGKERLRRLSEEASQLSLQFSQNLLKENKAYRLNITDSADLDGLPQTAIDAAAQAARENGETGWTFTLDTPSYSPFITYSTRRDLRRQMYMARNTVCTHDNAENNLALSQRIVNIRREVAQLLGYKTYADYVLRRRMASDTAHVYSLLDHLIAAYRPTALHERADIEALARREQGEEFQLEPWDTAFYSHRLQKERYNIDAEMLRPYLQLENVITGVFGLATRLYGITFKENSAIPVYHPDVRAYEVLDNDGSYLAVLYADFHPRKGKQGGAWMTEFQGQSIDDDGTDTRPHVSLVMNLTKPTAEKPALLTLGEVETFLHEFGHALHGMFARTHYESLSGTNVWWDFVELPSQFMENYATEPEFLHSFAVHYLTGEPLPDELIERVRRARNFNVAQACLRQVSFGLLDMAYHTRTEPLSGDIPTFEREAWKAAIIAPQREDTAMTPQFSHIMAGGYAAGYYSYKWAEVLDADAFAVFKREGIFNRETAQRFRDCVLSRGGTEHPMTLYRRFRGAEPTIDALVERDGIKQKM